MSKRPAIPAAIEREILLECGHRCAVCGTPTPLERAHIIPWYKTKEHKAKDLICLCANCHQRADNEKWGETTLREYKQRPWVMRHFEKAVDLSPSKSKIKININMEVDHFDDKQLRWLQSGLAGFLEISPNSVQILKIEEGSVKVIISLPTQSARRLLAAFELNDPELSRYISPLSFIEMNPLQLEGEWYSIENLKLAWKFARHDKTDDFIYDVIDSADIKYNIDRVLKTLHTQIREDLYYPAPLLHVNVPKNDHSYRPGSSIPLVDLIVLYALAQQLVPLLDSQLSDSVYAYRLNPEADASMQPLIKNKKGTPDTKQHSVNDPKKLVEEQEDLADVEFPYNWFINWKLFHDATKSASKDYDYVAVTDITAYFENISQDLLRESLKEMLDINNREIIDRLFRLLEFWNWNPSGNLPRGIGLPQGNDVSSFLSNLYLLDLDRTMLSTVSWDTSKYYRYVDDIKLFTSNRSEAQRALVKLEEVLRRLNLNVQSAKTEILPSNKIFDFKVESWLEKMGDDEPLKVESAQDFFDNEFELTRLDDLQRPYIRCLTILREAADDRAVEISLESFLTNPSYRLLIKNFLYLRNFVTEHHYCESILRRLQEESFTFPYHRAYMFRLAAYSRENFDEFKEYTLAEAFDTDADWFSRMSALFCLSTFPLTGKELARIEWIINNESHPQVLRAAFIVMCQHTGDGLKGVVDRVSLFNAPNQDYFRRYFLMLYRDKKAGEKHLSRVDNVSLRAPTFIFNLHQLDLMKGNQSLRNQFNKVLNSKLEELTDNQWSRLNRRLEQIYDQFILNI